MLITKYLFLLIFLGVAFDKQNYFLHNLVEKGLVIRLDHHADQALRSRRAHQNAGRTGNPRLDGGERVDPVSYTHLTLPTTPYV